MSTRSTHLFLRISLFSLALAASTGALMRYGLVYGMPSWAANFAAVRHAHSHLMYFGWVSLAIMALIWQDLPWLTGRPAPPWATWQMTASAIMALLSFPAFWANGYGLTQIRGAELPLGSMLAAFNGMTWLWFIALYVKNTRGLRVRPLAVQMWDWALVLLLVASAGAAGLAGLVVTGISSIFLQQAFLHLFLDLFAVGWFTLAMLGLIWSHLGIRLGIDSLPKWLPTQSLALALAPTFILGMAPVMVTPRLFWPAVIANLIAGGLLAVHLFALWQHRAQLPRLLHFAGLVLAIHAAIALTLVWPGVWRWSSGTSLRVFFLHNLLLGWTSTALLGLIWAKWGAGAEARQPAPNQIISWLGLGWLTGVAVMLLALLGLGFTQFLPIPARLLFQIAFWAGTLLAGVAVVQLFVRADAEK